MQLNRKECTASWQPQGCKLLIWFLNKAMCHCSLTIDTLYQQSYSKAKVSTSGDFNQTKDAEHFKFLGSVTDNSCWCGSRCA